jgi:alginate O-acetyltransferase complex protein AlgJ
MKARISEAPLINLREEKRRLLLVPAVVILLVLTGGTAASLLDPGLYDPPPVRIRAVLDGSWTAEYQVRYEEELPLRSFARTVWGILRYALFREGEDGVLVGSGDWLFTTEEFAYPSDGKARMQESVEYVHTVRDRLAEGGIRLAVLIVPAKARVLPERLGRYEYPAYLESRYDDFLSAVRRLEITAPDTLTLLSHAKKDGSPFLRTDTHWSPYGADAVARGVAAEVLPILEAESVERKNYIRDTGDEVVYRGDLMNFLPLGPLADSLGPDPDRVVTRTTRKPDGSEGGLFGELTTPAVLVGTSYSAGSLWDFPGALEAAFGMDILDSSTEGEGPFVPMRDFLDEISERSDVNFEIVLWEIPERYVTDFSLDE